MKRCLLISLMVVLVSGLILTGCTQETPDTGAVVPGDSHEPVELTHFSSSLGSDAYNFAVAMGDIMKKNHDWISVSILESTGSSANVKDMADLTPEKQEQHIGLAVDIVLGMASKGVGPFGEAGQIDDWKVLFSLYQVQSGFLTLDPDIQNPSVDFVDKKIGLPPLGHGLTNTVMFHLNDCWELEGKCEYINMPMEMMRDALLDGTVDVIATGGAYYSEDYFKVSPFAEQVLASGRDVYFIGMTEEDFARGKAKKPDDTNILVMVQPGSLAEGMPAEETGILATGLTWFAWPNMDEEVAYELVKTMSENSSNFGEYFAGGEHVKAENYVLNAWSEERYHPGALRYYQEQGFTIPGEQ